MLLGLAIPETRLPAGVARLHASVQVRIGSDVPGWGGASEGMTSLSGQGNQHQRASASAIESRGINGFCMAPGEVPFARQHLAGVELTRDIPLAAELRQCGGARAKSTPSCVALRLVKANPESACCLPSVRGVELHGGFVSIKRRRLAFAARRCMDGNVKGVLAGVAHRVRGLVTCSSSRQKTVWFFACGCAPSSFPPPRLRARHARWRLSELACTPGGAH